MKNKTAFALMFMFALLVFPMVSADVIFQTLNETSQAGFEKSPNLEIQNAEVVINVTEGSLKAIFLIHSNEKEIIDSSVYLRAKGESCYSGRCWSDQFIETNFQVRYEKAMAENNCKWMQSINKKSVDWDNYYSCTLYSDDYETPEGVFQKTNEFKIYPNDTFILYVEQHNINFPFQYYLDSLSTFSKAEHEKITIYGENLNVEFNEEYPVKKISENEWVWEYNNINTADKNLKDILVIFKSDSPEPEPKKSFFQKIVDWFRNLF